MDLPTISLDLYLSDPTSPAAREEALKAAESLILTGALIVKDSRAPKESNDRFLDLIEDYFAQSDDVLRKDERPEVGYQVVSPIPIVYAIEELMGYRESHWKIQRNRNVVVMKNV